MIQLTGVLSLKGPQLEAYWSIRTAQGTQWRLVVEANSDLARQLQQFNGQLVQISGVAIAVTEPPLMLKLQSVTVQK